MIHSINNNLQYNKYQKIENKEKSTDIKIEDLSKKLKIYNDKNNKNIKFIDLLEKINLNISTEERIKIKKDGNKLLEKVEKEINKLNGKNGYIEDLEKLTKDMNKYVDLEKKIFDIKNKLNKETNELKRKDLETKLIKLETKLIELIVLNK
jgi:hypothetical protein